MHPTVSYYLAQARTADLRHRAKRDAAARAARRARSGHRVPATRTERKP